MAQSNGKSKNVFLDPRPNKVTDISFIGLLSIIMIVFLIGYLQATQLQNFGTIYFYLTILIFIFLIIALLSKFRIFAWVIYGKETTETRFLVDVLIGVSIALVLTSGLIGLSIGIPLSVAATSSNLITFIIIAFYGPLTEEVFWLGTFTPSLARYLKNNMAYMLLAGTLILSILFIFLGIVYFGDTGIALGVGMLILCIFLEINGVFKRFAHIKINKYIPAMTIGALLITALHVYAYGSIITNFSAFAAAFAFFLIEGVVVYWRQSIVPSIMMHTTNNAIAGAVALTIPTIYGIPSPAIFIILMGLFLYSVFRLRKKVIGASGTSPDRFISQTIKGAY